MARKVRVDGGPGAAPSPPVHACPGLAHLGAELVGIGATLQQRSAGSRLKFVSHWHSLPMVGGSVSADPANYATTAVAQPTGGDHDPLPAPTSGPGDDRRAGGPRRDSARP